MAGRPKGSGEYKRERERIFNKYEWMKKEIKKLDEECAKKIKVELKNGFDSIVKQEIGKWYDDYSPSRYIRKYDLYNIYKHKIKLSDDYTELTITSTEGPENMKRKHRATHEYIYWNSFIRGWHGGADRLGDSPKKGYEMPHPRPRTGPLDSLRSNGYSYWRTPAVPPEDNKSIYRWMSWWRDDNWVDFISATNSPSPKDPIEKRLDEYCEEISNKYTEIYNKKQAEIVQIFANYVINHDSTGKLLQAIYDNMIATK